MYSETPMLETESERSEFLVVPVELVFADPANLRGPVDPECDEIRELAGSLASVGLLAPLTVRPRAAGGYFLVAGHRRFAAASLAGLARVPVVVRHLDDWQVTEAMLVENGLRESLHPRAEAEGYRKLLSAGKYTVAGLASRLKIRPQRIWERLHFLEDGPELTEAVSSGRLPGSVADVVRSAARALHTVPGALLQRMARDLGDEWTARQVREWCRGEKRKVDEEQKEQAAREAADDAARLERIKGELADGEAAAVRIQRIQDGVAAMSEESFRSLVWALVPDLLVFSSRLRLLSLVSEGAAWLGEAAEEGHEERGRARARIARMVSSAIEDLPPSGDLGVGAARCGVAPVDFPADVLSGNEKGPAACGVPLESVPADPLA